MKQNLNKYTRAELISKLNKLEQQNINKTEVPIKNNEIKISDLIWDILTKIRNLFFSLSIIAIFTKIFKNYKSVRAILKLANYIVLAIFGISIFEAFGLSFIVKFFNQFRYVFAGVISYLSDTTFYHYLMRVFNVAEEKQSIRSIYKQPTEKIDWKAELEKADRQKEIDKWMNKYGHKHEDEVMDKKTIALLLLFLGGTIAVWYYGKDALDIISPVWNMRDLIKRILRGGRDDNNNSPPTPDIELDPDSRAISPDMMVYASDMVNRKVAPTPPTAPPAPPIPEAPVLDAPAPTSQGAPSALFDQIKLGKKLKHTETIEKNKSLKGRVFEDINVEASSSKVENEKPSLTNALSAKFDQIKKAVSGDDDDIDNDWDDNSNQKGKEVERSISPDMLSYASDTVKVDKSQKFLEAIKHDDSNISESTSLPPKLSNTVKAIKRLFPNISEETINKLNSVEGIKNRQQIIDLIPDSELIPTNSEDNTPLSKLLNLSFFLLFFYYNVGIYNYLKNQILFVISK